MLNSLNASSAKNDEEHRALSRIMDNMEIERSFSLALKDSVSVKTDQEYRVLSRIRDNTEIETRSFRVALEDSLEQLQSISVMDGKVKAALNRFLLRISEYIEKLKERENIFRNEKEGWAKYGKILVKIEKEKHAKFVTDRLNIWLETAKIELKHDYGDNCIQNEQDKIYPKILSKIYSENDLYYARIIRSYYSVLGGEIDTLFDQFFASNQLGLPANKYVGLYFRILKAYATERTDSLSEFDRRFFEELDKNPYTKKCEALELETQIKASTPAGRLQQTLKIREIERTALLAKTFDAEQRPILEKRYLGVLEILGQINQLSEEEKQILGALKQKYPAENTPIKKKKKKKKKPVPAATPSSSSNSSCSFSSGKKEDEIDTALIPSFSPSNSDESDDEAETTKKVFTLDDDEEIQAETQEAIAQQQAQYAIDRAAKKSSPMKQATNATPGIEQETISAAQIIHAQNAKLADTFWHAKAMPWDDFVKFMHNIGGPMEDPKGGGSHRKFNFTMDDSALTLPAYEPHKFGSSKVGSRQLQNAREFLLSRKIAVPENNQQ